MSIAGLSLRDLEYVVAVAELGSFRRAAERCVVSQPSLSAQVRKLEDWFGARLFERTTRRVMVTPRGQTLIDQARRVLAEARVLDELARRSSAVFGGALRLAAIATLGPYLFPRVLPGLRRAYPDVALTLSEGRTETLLAQLGATDLDAVLVALPLHGDLVSSEALFVEPFVLACPAGHPAGLEGGPGWDELDQGERLLIEDGHCLHEHALAACAVAGSRNRHGTSVETLKYMVAAGEGCTLVPALAAVDDAGGLLRYRRIGGEAYGRTIGLGWRRSDPRGAEFQALAAVLRQIAGAVCPETVTAG